MTRLKQFLLSALVALRKKQAIRAMESNQPIQEQIARKQRSESILRSEDVPFVDHLPVIESEPEASIRSENEVEIRALCLVIVALKGEGLEQELIEKAVSTYGLASHFTPDEAAFIRNTTPTDQEKINFVWRYESAWVMLWALGFLDSLDRPNKIANVPKLVGIVRDNSTDTFQAAAKLRPKSEILDQADLIYRYHWAMVDARINGLEVPVDLDSSIIYERHYSLNWLIGYMGQEWDNVSTDT